MGKIGIIGGSGLYDIEGLKGRGTKRVSTPFGDPSDEFILGELAGKEIVFLARHGKGHRILPTELNYRANIYGMKKLGVDRIISVGAVGSLKEDLKPLHIVIPDQFVDRTNQARKTTFFGGGIVVHIAFGDPVCHKMCEILYEAGKKAGADIHKGGTYINMEGPAFSTRAESNLYRRWGMDIIGMTNMPEARLAREAEICFATLAMITDYDCWHVSDDVSVEMIIENLTKNSAAAKEILKLAIGAMPRERRCPCANALKDAIITPKETIPPETKKRLEPIIGKYIK